MLWKKLHREKQIMQYCRSKNSTEGIVTDIYDLLTEYQLYIVGEQGVKVEHVLLGIPETSLDEIKTVYSHPQALAQCKNIWKAIRTGKS